MQREIWFQCQLHADAPLYRLGLASTITGTLDRALFRARPPGRGRAAVGAAHRVSRARRRAQAVRRSRTWTWISTTRICPPRTSRASTSRRGRRAFSSCSRSSTASPSISAGRRCGAPRSLRVAEREHWLILLFHHLIVDGYHAGALIGEIGATYCRYAQGGRGRSRRSRSSTATSRCGSTSVSARGCLDEHEPYWLDRLRATQSDALLPRDRLAPASRRFVTDGIWRCLDPALADALAPLGRTCRATPYRLLLATFALMLGRLTGVRDVVVGQPFSTRPPELREVAGSVRQHAADPDSARRAASVSGIRRAP